MNEWDILSNVQLQKSFGSKIIWKKRSSYQGKKEVACNVSKPLVCGDVESL